MSDPFQRPPKPDFDAEAFAYGLLAYGAQQRDQLAAMADSAIEMLWHRSEEGWTIERAQAVLDVLGPRGQAVFAASFLLKAIATVGQISKTDPAVFASSAEAMQGVLAPYIQSGLITMEEISAPVKYTVDETGTIKVVEGQEYPGPKQQEEAPEDER